MSNKLQRHEKIIRAITSTGIRSQHDLRTILSKRGIKVTQATLSRDLQELGVSKGPQGYTLGPSAPSVESIAKNLERALQRELISAEFGGNMVVLRTRPGHANSLAVELDQAGQDAVMGCIAGDDTVFVCVRQEKQAKNLVERFLKLAGHDGSQGKRSSKRTASPPRSPARKRS